MTGGSGAAQVWCRISFHNGAIHLDTASRLCSTAALQHCSLHTALKLDRHISVHWSSVWSHGGLL